MRVRILGSAAGGGLPQWNCRCANCDAARRGDPAVPPRTQSSVAVSADGERWFLLNASPDVRQQLVASAGLWPPGDQERGTALAGCVVTDSEIDHTTGLLLLREGCSLPVYCTSCVGSWLSEYYPIRSILSHFAQREWRPLELGQSCELADAEGQPSGLVVECFETDQHVPRFVTDPPTDLSGSVIGLSITDQRTGGCLVYAPCVGKISSDLDRAAQRADGLLIDGTFWDDDEPVRAGVGERTATEMGHLPVGGEGGTLRWLSTQRAAHRRYVHLNNTNPLLRRGSPQESEVLAAGVRVAMDGDEFEL